MVYTVGGTISNSDYNGLLNNTASGTPNAGVAARGINYIAGTGAGEYGLGQTELTAVGSTDLIQAAQWNSLFTFMNNIQNHTNITALTSTTAAAAGDLIAIKSALTTDLTALATAVAGGSVSATTGLTDSAATNKDTGPITRGSSATVSATFTFASEDAARHFFNGGGKIKLSFSRVGSGGAAGKDDEWTDITSRMGTIIFAAHSTSRSGGSSTNTTLSAAVDFYALTATNQTIATATANTGVYNSDAITLSARRTGFVGTRGGNGTAVVITMVCNADVENWDDAGDNVGSIRMACVASNVNTADGLGTGTSATIT